MVKNRMMSRMKNSFNDYVLSEITKDINNFSLENVVDDLSYLYGKKGSESDSFTRKTAVFLNALFTHGYTTFLLTRRGFQDLLKTDPNYGEEKSGSVNGSVFNTFMARAKEHGYIKEIRKPLKGKSGVYEVTCDQILQNLRQHYDLTKTSDFVDFDKYQQLRRERILDYYDTKGRVNKVEKINFDGFDSFLKDQLKKQVVKNV